MPSLRDRAIPQKITFVIMAITAVVLLLAFGALFYFQACILKQHAVHELAVVGEITARECGPAVLEAELRKAADPVVVCQGQAPALVRVPARARVVALAPKWSPSTVLSGCP